jgi:trk system potassium uptake protein
VFPSDETSLEIFGNAFFSSAAGFTTGGISLFDEPEQLTQSFTFYRSYTQLVGGMSFIYLVITAFYPESKLQSMRGFISGRTLHMKELFLTITVIFAVYIVIVAVLLYLFGSRNPIDDFSPEHLIDNFSLAMSTLSTGGFTPTSTILEDLLWQEHLILMGAMILGALPFTFHYAFVRKKFLSPKLGKEVLTYFGILGGATILFIGISGLEPLQSAFYSVSASTTAGLQQESLAGLNGGAHTILIILMFIGGCGFSTAGGLKIFRLFHLKNCRSFFSKIKRQELSNQSKKELISTLIILALFPTISAITGAHLAAIEDVPFQDAFFEAAGIITTGGLSAGIIDFDTDTATKIVLGFLMIFGRLEIIAIIYIFVPKLS